MCVCFPRQVLFGGYGGENRAAKKAEKEAAASKLASTKGLRAADLPPAKHPDLFILDTVTMEWVQPEARGTQPSMRCVFWHGGGCVPVCAALYATVDGCV